jgi:hypothetical protein
MNSSRFLTYKTIFIAVGLSSLAPIVADLCGQTPGASAAALSPVRNQVDVQLRQPPKDSWDHAKAVAELLAPVTTAFFGIWILLITKRLERSQWRSQKLIEKRIEIWDKVGPQINDIFCYCVRVGNWKAFEPPSVIQKKRDADQQIHLSRPYFSAEFFRRYQDFVASCFEVFQRHGEDAKLKTPISEHKNVRSWNPKWDSLFLASPGSESQQYRAYDALIEQAGSDFSPR